jgi:O-antigen/teichoic acid export membrane protein
MVENKKIGKTNRNDAGLYKSTFKSTLVYGSVKLFTILIKVLRVKIVAIILGPTGMGIQSLLGNLLSTLHQFTTFGIYQSSVRDISYNAAHSQEKTEDTIRALNTLAFLFGLLGLLICVCFSGQLSQYVFGDRNYSFAVILVGIALLFESIYSGKIAVFQGLRKIKSLASASLIGGVAGLAVCWPLYYHFGEKAIPYVLVCSTIVIFLSYFIFSRRLKPHVPDSMVFGKKLKEFGTPIVKLGTILMFSNGLMTIYSLVLNTFIREVGSITDVGLFGGASTATYGCITVLVSVLASDLYPRLAAVVNDKEKFDKMVNSQLELLLQIAVPVVCFLTIFPKFIVSLLLSSSYYVVIPLVQLMAMSLIFRIIWHTFSFVILAHGHKNTYFVYDAIIGNGLNFVMNMVAYYFWGLDGLAYSYVCGAVSMTIILYCLMRFKYKLRLNTDLKLQILAFVAIAVLSYFVRIWSDGQTLIPSFVLLASVCVMSLYMLNKKIGLVEMIKSKLKR